MSLVHIGFRIRDDDGDSSTFGIKLPLGTLTLTELTGFADQIAPKIDNCIDGVIDAITISIAHSLPGGLATTPAQYSEVQKGALFSFDAADTDYRHSIRIPAFSESKFSGNSVNTGDAQVMALEAAFVTGESVGGTMVLPCDKYENDLISLISAVKSFRRK